MSSKFLLHKAPTGIQHSIEVTDEGFNSFEFTPSCVENEILDGCAAMRGVQQNANAKLRHAASTPLGLNAVWRKEWEQHYKDKMPWMQFKVMKLNSRDNSRLRTGYKRSGSMKI